jgi:hypothetical protein
MTLIRLPHPPVKFASDCLDFSSVKAPSAKLTININAFNGNTTIFGKKK